MDTGTDVKLDWRAINAARAEELAQEIEGLETDRTNHTDAAKALTATIREKRQEREAVLAYEHVGKPRRRRRSNAGAQDLPLITDLGTTE